MRNRDLAGVSLLLSIGLIYFSVYLLPILGIRIGFLGSFSSHVIASFLLFPVILLVLTPLNNRFRQWRKARGRDIDEEEKYETEYGMTKLTPNETERDSHDDVVK